MNFISFFPSKNYFKEELIYYFPLKYSIRDFPGGPVVKISPSNTGGVGSIPGQGAKIPRASWPKSKNRKQKQYCNKFSKDLKKKKYSIKQMAPRSDLLSSFIN